MKQVKTLSNSFVLIESDSNGKVINKLGFRKSGLSYLIKNNNIKFYLTEDYFYKNVVWSADLPLMVDGILYDVNTIQQALKKIFINEKDGGGGSEITVDQTLNTGSTNPIGNQAVAKAVNNLSEQIAQNTRDIMDRYTKAQTNSLLASYYTKLETNAMFVNYSKVEGNVISLNNENITV
jgi:hypothetical protein